MLASLALFFGNMASLALDVLLLFLQLALYVSLALWLLDRLPARCQAVLDFLSSLLALGDAAASAAPASSPARPLSAPVLASAPLLASARPLSASFWQSGTPQILAWDRRSVSDTSSLVDKESVQLFHDWYERRVRESRQKKTVRFASGVQAQPIPSRHSVAHSEPVSAAAPALVAEPWDAVAWSARLEVFHKAISMPNCSLLPDPRLALGVAAPVQQQAPVWRPGIVQQAPAAPAPPPSPPKVSAPPPSSPDPTTTTTCKPEKLQQDPPPPSPPKPSSPPPAATQVQDPSAAAKAPAPTKPPAASTTANTTAVMPQTSFNFSFANPFAARTAPAGLTAAQQRHWARMQSALQVLEDVMKHAAGLRGTLEQNRTSAWCDATKGTTKQMKMDEIARSLRIVRDVSKNDMGELNERVMPRGELEKMLLKGEKFDEMVKGFTAGYGVLKDAGDKGFDGMLAMGGIVGVLQEMQGFFDRY